MGFWRPRAFAGADYVGKSIAISRELLAAGVEQKTANAVAEAIVNNSDTKVEILELKADLREEINAMRNQLLKLEAKVDAEAKKSDMRFNEMNSRFNLLTIIVVIGILAPYIERAFGG